MDLTELDSWYEEQKQLILDKHIAEVKDGKPKDVSKKKFEKKMEQLLASYKRKINGELDRRHKQDLKKIYRRAHPTFFDKIKERYFSKHEDEESQ